MSLNTILILLAEAVDIVKQLGKAIWELRIKKAVKEAENGDQRDLENKLTGDAPNRVYPGMRERDRKSGEKKD